MIGDYPAGFLMPINLSETG